MISFNEKDVIAILNFDPIVKKSGFKIVKKVVEVHPKSEEIEIRGSTPKGGNFLIRFAEIKNVKSTIESILSYGQKGYTIDKNAPTHFVPPTEMELLWEGYHACGDKIKEGFIQKVNQSQIKFFVDKENSFKSFEDHRVIKREYLKFCTQHNFEIESFRQFILDFSRKMKKFVPTPSMVLKSVYEKEKAKSIKNEKLDK